MIDSLLDELAVLTVPDMTEMLAPMLCINVWADNFVQVHAIVIAASKLSFLIDM